MSARPYSENVQAGRIFADALNSVVRRGWFSAGPSAEDGQSVLYASFHVHPEDADYLYTLLQWAIASYAGVTTWSLCRLQQNRFILCTDEVSMCAGHSGEIGDVAHGTAA